MRAHGAQARYIAPCGQDDDWWRTTEFIREVLVAGRVGLVLAAFEQPTPTMRLRRLVSRLMKCRGSPELVEARVTVSACRIGRSTIADQAERCRQRAFRLLA
jgi:hypothetical protein